MKIRAARLKRLIPRQNAAKVGARKASRSYRDAHPLVLSLPTGSTLAHEDVDRKPVAAGHVPNTQPFSAEEGTDVGIDNETGVSSDYEPASSKFTGQIESVTIAVAPSKLTAVDQKSVDYASEAAKKAAD